MCCLCSYFHCEDALYRQDTMVEHRSRLMDGRRRHSDTESPVQNAHHDPREEEKNGFSRVLEKLDEQLIAR